MHAPLAPIELRASPAQPAPSRPLVPCSKKAMAVACPILCYGGTAFGAWATFKLGAAGLPGLATIAAGVTLINAVLIPDRLNRWAGVGESPGWVRYMGNLALAPLYAARHLWKGGRDMEAQAPQPEEPV